MGDPVNAVDPYGLWAVKIPLGFGSYLYLADKGWVRGSLKIYVSLYMTAGGFLLNALAAITGGSGRIVAWALRYLGATRAAQLGWKVANYVRGFAWKYSAKTAGRVSRTSGLYARFFWARTHVYYYPLIV